MKNVLIIGGSVFVGRVFSIRASQSKKFNLHVVNRGNFPMELDRVSQYKCSRHSPRMIARLIPNIRYDALVDFCAYNPGEIESVISALGKRVRQYIYFSSAGIYSQSDGFRDESSELYDFPEDCEEPAAVYRRKKIALEHELAEACAKAGIKYTILRPTFIYGPYNYTPRESYFIGLIAKRRVVPVPTDALAHFSFVYVIDVAEALIKCIGNKNAYNETFNLAGTEAITYQRLISDFEQYNNGPFETREVTVAQIKSEQIPLPFPMSEDSLVDGQKFARTFNFKYTPFAEGMKSTFNAFYSLYNTT